MEARLGATIQVASRATQDETPVPAGEDTSEAVAAASDGAPNAWPDESAESAMLSELRARGEPPVVLAPEAVEEPDTKNLPALDELVKRLPPEVREALDDLFRARFVAVRRVPQRALTKSF